MGSSPSPGTGNEVIKTMDQEILNHYLKFSTFTNPGFYKPYFHSLPDDIRELGNLVSHQIIHRVTLREGNTNANQDLRYGDMDEYPWHRLRCEDDTLTTAVSMVAELFRLDSSGFVTDRKVENKIVVTCRYTAILMASILKSKEIPCRVRSGFAPYFLKGSWDHWINQYWDKNQERWVTFDADGFLDYIGFDQYDMPHDKFDWAAATWLGVRKGALNPDNFINTGGFKGLEPILWAVFYDFHSLMNNEILYLQAPVYIHNKFDSLTEKELKEIDALAEFLMEPDKNFVKLRELWETDKKFRILNGPLINDADHVRWK
ncbi:MAG TPA: transglutaminase-like domain-containing protein [Dehalococcoidales bacterium]|nr:transglutaminase-like domain-containing protein [Dehalococcoidales bacterium]